MNKQAIHTGKYVSSTQFEVRMVAGSAKYKQSKTGRNDVVL